MAGRDTRMVPAASTDTEQGPPPIRVQTIASALGGFFKLPDELFLKILRHATPEDIQVFSLVCRAAYSRVQSLRASEQGRYVHRLGLRHWPMPWSSLGATLSPPQADSEVPHFEKVQPGAGGRVYSHSLSAQINRLAQAKQAAPISGAIMPKSDPAMDVENTAFTNQMPVFTFNLKVKRDITYICTLLRRGRGYDALKYYRQVPASRRLSLLMHNTHPQLYRHIFGTTGYKGIDVDMWEKNIPYTPVDVAIPGIGDVNILHVLCKRVSQGYVDISGDAEFLRAAILEYPPDAQHSVYISILSDIFHFFTITSSLIGGRRNSHQCMAKILPLILKLHPDLKEEDIHDALFNEIIITNVFGYFGENNEEIYNDSVSECADAVTASSPARVFITIMDFYKARGFEVEAYIAFLPFADKILNYPFTWRYDLIAEIAARATLLTMGEWIVVDEQQMETRRASDASFVEVGLSARHVKEWIDLIFTILVCSDKGELFMWCREKYLLNPLETNSREKISRVDARYLAPIFAIRGRTAPGKVTPFQKYEMFLERISGRGIPIDIVFHGMMFEMENPDMRRDMDLMMLRFIMFYTNDVDFLKAQGIRGVAEIVYRTELEDPYGDFLFPRDIITQLYLKGHTDMVDYWMTLHREQTILRAPYASHVVRIDLSPTLGNFAKCFRMPLRSLRDIQRRDDVTVMNGVNDVEFLTEAYRESFLTCFSVDDGQWEPSTMCMKKAKILMSMYTSPDPGGDTLPNLNYQVVLESHRTFIAAMYIYQLCFDAAVDVAASGRGIPAFASIRGIRDILERVPGVCHAGDNPEHLLQKNGEIVNSILNMLFFKHAFPNGGMFTKTLELCLRTLMEYPVYQYEGKYAEDFYRILSASHMESKVLIVYHQCLIESAKRYKRPWGPDTLSKHIMARFRFKRFSEIPENMSQVYDWYSYLFQTAPGWWGMLRPDFLEFLLLDVGNALRFPGGTGHERTEKTPWFYEGDYTRIPSGERMRLKSREDVMAVVKFLKLFLSHRDGCVFSLNEEEEIAPIFERALKNQSALYTSDLLEFLLPYLNIEFFDVIYDLWKEIFTHRIERDNTNAVFGEFQSTRMIPLLAVWLSQSPVFEENLKHFLRYSLPSYRPAGIFRILRAGDFASYRALMDIDVIAKYFPPMDPRKIFTYALQNNQLEIAVHLTTPHPPREPEPVVNLAEIQWTEESLIKLLSLNDECVENTIRCIAWVLKTIVEPLMKTGTVGDQAWDSVRFSRRLTRSWGKNGPFVRSMLSDLSEDIREMLLAGGQQ